MKNSPLHVPRSPPLTGSFGHSPLNSGNLDGAAQAEEPPQLTLRETAIDACSRKEHAVNKGYFRDPFLKHFTGDNTYVNSPLMNRGYWLRVKAVESAINRFLEMFPEDAVQVISLGAGYDTTYFRWAAAACAKHDEHVATASGASLHLPTSPNIGDFGRLHRWVEVDHGDVFDGKREIILQQDGMNDLAHLKSDQELVKKEEKEMHTHSNCMFRMVDCDLRKPETLVDALLNPSKAQSSCVIPTEHDSGHSLIDPTMPTLILAECVLVYMTAEESTKCLDTLVNQVFDKSKSKDVGVVLVSYDAIAPDDRFGKVMVETLSKRGIPLKGIKDLKSPEAHEARARSVGFNAVRSQTMKQLHDTVTLEEKKHLDMLERIDDWEEWDLLHNHYCLTFAGRLTKENSEKRGGHMPNLFLGTFKSSEFVTTQSSSGSLKGDASVATAASK